MTTSPSDIPEAAIEAAAEAYMSGETGESIWHHSDTEAEAKRRARVLLEAAAPHMLAECWDAGAKATADYELEYRVNFDFGDDLPEPPTNPYRPTK